MSSTALEVEPEEQEHHIKERENKGFQAGR
jgi:hypothetical protein